MSFLEHLHRSHDKDATVPMNYDASGVIMHNPEPIGAILGRVGIVWAGLFAGISLGDVVLFATLVYTLLQIGLTVYERIIKPIRAARAEVVALKVTAVANTAARIETQSTGQSGPQEK